MQGSFVFFPQIPLDKNYEDLLYPTFFYLFHVHFMQIWQY